MRIIFSTDHRSRLYGWATEESDYAEKEGEELWTILTS